MWKQCIHGFAPSPPYQREPQARYYEHGSEDFVPEVERVVQFLLRHLPLVRVIVVI